MSGHWPPEWEDPEEEYPGEAEAGDARLSEVTAYLSSVPAPVLPDAIEARISAALAAEAAGRASATRLDGGGTGDDARPLGPAPARARVRRHRGGGRPRLAPRTLLTAGSLVVCLLLAGFGYLLSRGAPTTSSTVAGASASAVEPEFGRPGANFAITESGTKYQSATLAAQVRARLAVSGSPVQVPGPMATKAPVTNGSNSEGASSLSTEGLRGCVSHLTGGAVPRLVDRATYQGEAAYVIAISSRVWVVGLGCTAANPQLIATAPLAGSPGTSAP
jgi:hypothetical protein